MLLGITNQGKVGLAVCAGLLIVFAILSSFYFPRRNPDFPGNRLGLFVGIAAVLFVVTMAGVFVFAAEEEEAGHDTEAAETHTTETGTTPGTTTAAGGAGGDAAAGEAVFASAGCGGCHTLGAAGSSGAVGPNLDDAKPDEALVVERVTNGSGVMPPFGDSLSEQQIKDVAAYVVASTQG
ncbi:MAG TPA: cytochrome c [Gaiellaceae bacterium]|nr:cytochrome c [Gaiellaceae bacterium]